MELLQLATRGTSASGGFKNNSISPAPSQQLLERTSILESAAIIWEWMPRVTEPYSAANKKGTPHAERKRNQMQHILHSLLACNMNDKMAGEKMM